MDDLQGDEAQEVHLEHAHILNIMPVKLRGTHVFARFLILGQANGQIIRKVSAADDGGAGVHAYLADATFQRLGVLEHLFVDFRAVLEFFYELGHQTVAVLEVDLDIHVFHALLEGLLDLDHLAVLFFLHFFFHDLETGFQFVQLGVEGVFLLFLLAQAVWHHLGEAVALVNADPADAGHILDGAFGGHGAEGDYAGNVAGPILLLHIVVSLGQIFKVHIYIRHGNTVRIEETLEQELVLDGV